MLRPCRAMLAHTSQEPWLVHHREHGSVSDALACAAAHVPERHGAYAAPIAALQVFV